VPEPISLLEAVAILPNSDEGVRDLMYALGIKGHRGDVRDCPLSQWLTRRTGKPVEVWQDEVISLGEHCNLPFHLQMFVEQFDHNNLEGGEAILLGT